MVHVYSGDRDASLNADDMASQTVRLKEEQLRKEEEKVITILGLLSHITHSLPLSSLLQHACT